jgi:hypothetical protein
VIREADVRRLIRELFREQALALGDSAALYGLDDELVWSCIRDLDGIRRRALRRLNGLDRGGSGERAEAVPKLHPAAEEFLHKLKKGAA